MANHAGAYPGFCSMNRLEVFLLPHPPLDGMLVHPKVILSIKFAGTHLYTWVERGTVRVKCPAQEHSTTYPARARTRTECTTMRPLRQKSFLAIVLSIYAFIVFLQSDCGSLYCTNDGWSCYSKVARPLDGTYCAARHVRLFKSFKHF